jgi:hypothetical protein
MSVRLLGAWINQWPIIQTAVDDLESFLWLLIWVIVHILKDKERATTHNIGIKIMLQTYSASIVSQRSKEIDVECYWTDTVFRGLIHKWISIFRLARIDIRKLSQDLIETPLDSPQRGFVCSRLESYCMRIYNDILESGFGHLKDIRKYSTWDEVVDANMP